MVAGKEIIRGLAGYSLTPIATALMTVLAVPLVSNFYPAEEYAKISIFYSVGAIVSNLAFLGLDSSFIRFFYNPPKSISTKFMAVLALSIAFAVNLVLLIAILLTCPQAVAISLFGEDNVAALVVLSVYIAASIAFRMSNTIARMKSEVRSYNLQQILQNAISKFLFVVAVVISTNFFPSIVVMAFGSILVSAFFVIKQRRNFGTASSHPAKHDIMQLFTFGIPCCINGLVLILSTSIGKIILGWLGLFEEAGVLAIAMTLASAFTILPQAFSLYWSPFMYKNHALEHRRICEMHDYVMAASLIAVCAIVVGQDVLYMLVGTEYAASRSYFMLLMTAPIATLICETTGYGTMIANKPMYVTAISVVAIVINAGLTIALAPIMGGFSAGIAVCVSSVFLCIAKTMTGQLFYPCIDSLSRSSVSALAILFLCLGNCFFYDFWEYKVISMLLTSCVLAFCYRSEIGKVRTLFGKR